MNKRGFLKSMSLMSVGLPLSLVNLDKLILDYDTYDPNGTLNVQVILVMPKIISPWTVQYSNTIETRFNNFVQSTNELVECKLQVQENIQAYT